MQVDILPSPHIQNNQNRSSQQWPEWMDTKTAARYMGLSRQWLEISRHKKSGPRYSKLSSRVRYRKSDLDAYMEARLVDNSQNQ